VTGSKGESVRVDDLTFLKLLDRWIVATVVVGRHIPAVDRRDKREGGRGALEKEREFEVFDGELLAVLEAWDLGEGGERDGKGRSRGEEVGTLGCL
jgi:hypothetical protein